MGLLSSGQRDTESGTFTNMQERGKGNKRVKTKGTNRDSRSAFDTRDTGDLRPYTELVFATKHVRRLFWFLFFFQLGARKLKSQRVI